MSTKYRGIADKNREIQCAVCCAVMLVGQAVAARGDCPNCGVEICVYCGCSAEAACIHPDFPNGELNCSWTMPSICSFCLERSREEDYYIASGRPERIKEPPPRIRPMVLPVAHL